MMLTAPQGTDGRIGVTLPLGDLPLAQHREPLRSLFDCGFGDMWAGEASGLDAITPLAAAAAWLPGVRVGTSILPAATRGPGVLATTAAGLAEMAPGRASIGIGSSSPVVVTNWNDRPHDRPYQRVRDTLRFLRSALAGDRVDAAYETFEMRGFRLERPPSHPPSLLIAALRPQMLRLAATEADGAITTWLPLSRAGVVSEEYRRHGGSRLVAWVTVCPIDDPERVRASFRRNIAAYLTVPSYAAFFSWLGLDDVLAPMAEAWAAGDRRAALAAIPDALVDDLIVHGSPDACREQLQRYLHAGVDELALSVLPGLVDPLEALLAIAPNG